MALGKIVSPSAASEPVIPVAITQNKPIAITIRSNHFAEDTKGRGLFVSHLAVSVSAATSDGDVVRKGEPRKVLEWDSSGLESAWGR